jgi:hypothetical protein
MTQETCPAHPRRVRYAHTPALLAGSQANFQLLANGNAFIGWQLPYFSEYGPSGEVLFDGHLAGATQSYRAYRFAWSGTPTGSPAIAAGRAPGGAVTVYASWNGATTVASWTVLAGPSPHRLTPVANPPRAGLGDHAAEPSGIRGRAGDRRFPGAHQHIENDQAERRLNSSRFPHADDPRRAYGGLCISAWTTAVGPRVCARRCECLAAFEKADRLSISR